MLSVPLANLVELLLTHGRRGAMVFGRWSKPAFLQGPSNFAGTSYASP